MVVTLDLNNLPARDVLPIIEWCFNHDVDRYKCIELITEWHSKFPSQNVEWKLDIPEKHMTFIAMKWLL